MHFNSNFKPSLLSIIKNSSVSPSDVHNMRRSHSYSKQILKRKYFCRQKSGQTCLAMYFQTNVGLLCCVGSGPSVDQCYLSRQKSEHTLSSCHKHLLSLKLSALDSSYCSYAHTCQAAAFDSCEVSMYVCVCVYVELALCRTCGYAYNVHCSNLTGCHTMAALLMIKYVHLVMLATEALRMQVRHVWAVPRSTYGKSHADTLRLIGLQHTLENACAYCLRPRVRVIRPA